MNLLLLFIILNIVNVVLQTIKSLATVKCGKVVAAVINAIAYGLYTYVIIYTNADLPMFTKACVVAFTNLVGVYIVKSVEEMMKKDKLWKIEITTTNCGADTIREDLKANDIPYNNYRIDPIHWGFNVYARTQKESEIVHNLIKQTDAKYFASECKIL